MNFRLTSIGAALLLALCAACNSAPAAAPTARPTAPATPAVTGSSSALANAPGLASPGASPSASPSSGAAAAGAPKQFNAPPPMTIDPNKQYIATIDTTMGKMVATLYAKEDPRTVNNFVFLAQQGFYNGVPFHRVIKNFMIQTGDPTGTGTGGPGYKFNDEPVTRHYEKGTLAMANSGPNTNGSQFFIVQGPQGTTLPPNYTIFGQVTQGLDVVDQIANVPTGPGKGGPDTPKTPVGINTITIQEQ